MRKHLYLALSFVLLLVGLQACDSANPVAPNSSMLFISASPTQIPLRGTSTITVTGFKPDGNPLNPGTQIVFQATFGTVEPRIAGVDRNGRAVTYFTSDGTLPPAAGGMNPQPASAQVTASLAGSGGGGGDGMGGGSTGGGPTVSVDIQIGETKPLLTLSVTPNVLSLGETADVVAQVRNADGSNFGAGGRVELRTTLGRLDSSSVVTDANGEARTVFHALNDPGTATITGFVGSGDAVTTDVMIENQKPVLIISANPTIISVSESSEITVLARDNNGVPLGADLRVRLTANLGTLDSDEIFTDSNGEAITTYTAGLRAGQGSVSAILGSSDPVSVNFEIQDRPASFTFTVNQTFVPSNGGSLDLTATVVNAEGIALGGVLVRFESSIGGSFSPSQSVTTSSRGEAQTTVTFAASDLTAGSTFTVSATVRIGDQDVTQSQPIEVR